MRLLRQGRTAFAPRFYEIKERDLTLCACQLKGFAIEVKDEQLPLSIKTEYGWEMAYNATTWTERSNPSWHTPFGLVGSCYAWPSRDPRSKCYAWCAWENSILCVPCIRGGRLKISAKSSQGQTIQLRRMRFVKATLRLGLRAPFVPAITILKSI